MPICSKDQSGFTLLELLMVVSILAIVSGGLYTMYDPMEAKALKSRTISDLVTLDRSIRTFHSLSGEYPTPLDNLLVENTSLSETTRKESPTDHTQGIKPISDLPPSVTSQIGPFTLTAASAQALQSSGINQLSTIPNSSDLAGNIRTVREGDHVAAIQSGCQGRPFVEGFDLQIPHDSSILHRQLGLDPHKCHLVVVFGLGDQASIVSNPEGKNPVTLSSTPQYLHLSGSTYNNYLLLFHLGTSSDANLQSSEIFPSAKFAGVYNPTAPFKKVASFSPQP